MPNPQHKTWTVSSTAYLRNLEPEELQEECIAIHYQQAPVEHGDGRTSIFMKFPTLILSGYVSNKQEIAEKIAAILEEHWHA